MPKIRIEAPAKLNLHLRIGGKRSDGYHDIDSVFLALAFGDTLHFQTASPDFGSGALEITMNWQFFSEGLPPDIPPEKNIISRAVCLFREHTGFEAGLKIAVEKRIPCGSGLGGGSSDAAAALLVLNSLFSSCGGRPVSAEALCEMGAALGSDVPFFLSIADPAAGSGFGGAAVKGRGEKVRPFTLSQEMRSLVFLLVNPGFPSDTASAYRLLDEARAGEEETESEEREQGSLFPIPHSPFDWSFANDFLPAFEKAAPLCGNSSGSVYRDIISGLKAAGAGFAGLSGSGSTCFGAFISTETAQKAKNSLLKNNKFYMIETFPLALCPMPYYNIRK